MRIPVLLSVFGAAAILACSSGGPGSLGDSALDLGREPVSDGQFFSPYEAPPNKGASVQTGSNDSNGTPTTSGKDGGKVTVDIDANIPSGFDASVTITDSGSTTTKDTGTTPTGVCADLQTCCDSLSGTTRTQCSSIASSNSDSTCQQALDSLVDAGKC
ncbi:MAG: hypothetical protein U0235_08710 [Polyangiaceae bacterium]